jgi:hypothetical protein
MSPLKYRFQPRRTLRLGESREVFVYNFVELLLIDLTSDSSVDVGSDSVLFVKRINKIILCFLPLSSKISLFNFELKNLNQNYRIELYENFCFIWQQHIVFG